MIDLSLLLAVALLFVLGGGYLLFRRSRRDQERLHLAQAQLERERDEQALRASRAEAQLDALGLAVLEVVVVVDQDLQVTYTTPGARALFETGEEGVGRSLIALS